MILKIDAFLWERKKRELRFLYEDEYDTHGIKVLSEVSGSNFWDGIE